jgi:hypothetical protein
MVGEKVKGGIRVIVKGGKMSGLRVGKRRKG